MKHKIVIFLVLSALFIPIFSKAIIMVPQPNLTVIVNTQGGEGNFYFDLQSYSGIFYEGFQDFYLQTENFTANTQLIAHQTTDYVLTQENLPGFKIKSINCSQDDPTAPEVSFSYQIDGVSFSSDQLPIWEQKITCIFDDVKINSKTPVLFVPGLMGTNVKEGNELLWADLDKMFNNIGDSFMDDLQFKNDLSPKVNGLIPSDVIRELETALGLVNFDYTKSLINEFKNQGYVENQDLFTFPYDWRYGVSGKYADGTTNSDLLAKKIQDIMAQTGSAKVDVVAHSLGGLIVKQYVINHPTDNYIGKAVFVGVPNTGSVKAAKALLEGDNFGIPWLADSEIKKISANMPAAYDLLPSQQYYDNAGSYIETIDQTQGDGVEKYLNHQESVNFLEGQGLNQLAINGAENLHTASFDNFDLRTAGVDLYSINGCKAATFGTVIYRKLGSDIGGGTDYGLGFGINNPVPGDNTVPLESATNLPIDANKKYYALVSEHGKMPSENGIRQEIVNLISGSNLSTSDIVGNYLITQDINLCQLNGKAISVFSPVNIFVTDQNGNKLGLAEDGSVVNEIPNADFEIIGEHKFLYLPQDSGQTYTINMQGTGTGTYTIKSQNISNSQPGSTEVFSNLPVTPALTGQIIFNSSNPSTGSGQATLLVKQNPTDKAVIILPTSTLDSQTSQDLIPPVSKIDLDGDQARDNVYKSNVEVKIQATDAQKNAGHHDKRNKKQKNKNNIYSGVLAIQYSLDGAGFKKVFDDKIKFKVSTEESHTVTFFATDKAGNNEQVQTVSFEIVKPKLLPKCKDDCKKDGWRKFGRIFRDQRDCDNYSDKKK